MKNYIPFLKFKSNEVAALSVISADVKSEFTPFFDLPRHQSRYTEVEAQDLVDKLANKTRRYLLDFPEFYVDDYDINYDVDINGAGLYEYFMQQFSEFSFVPVVALDRSEDRNLIVFDQKRSGNVQSDSVAIRLQREDFSDFFLCQDELDELLESCWEEFQSVDLILDVRYCNLESTDQVIRELLDFIAELARNSDFEFRRVVIAGSSIPGSISDVLGTEEQTNLLRSEMVIFDRVLHSVNLEQLFLGDYGIVSPYYSDLTIPPEAMRNVMAPKVLYPYENYFYVSRGGALRHHRHGATQFNIICSDIVARAFYRGRNFSFGDGFISDRANNHDLGVTPSSILKPTINANVIYMLSIF